MKTKAQLYFKQRTGEGLGLVGGHRPQVPQVRLVSDEHDDDVVVRVVPQLLQPPFHVLVGQVLGDVVHQQRPHRPAVVPVTQQYGNIFLLTGK